MIHSNRFGISARVALLAAAMSLAFASCGSGDDDGGNIPDAPLPGVAQTDVGAPGTADGLRPTFSSIHQQIFQAKCAGCHSGAQARGGINYDTYETTLASGVVVAGDSDASRLFQAVSSGRMPMGGPPLSEDEVTAIRDWILAGAQNG